MTRREARLSERLADSRGREAPDAVPGAARLRAAFEIMAGCPMARIDRATVNERVVLGCRTPGDGLFTLALKRELSRRGVAVPFVEYDLAGELRGARQPAFQRLSG